MDPISAEPFARSAAAISNRVKLRHAANTMDDKFGPESKRIRELGSGAAGLGWLSLNRYNAICLNSTKVFFADIDCVPSDKNPLKPVREWSEAAELAVAVAKQEHLKFRFYRTFAGLRLIETTGFHVAKDDLTLDRMRALGCDTAYIALTKKLNNFRVRLTPKPWRIPEPDAIDFSKGDEAIDHYLKNPKYQIADYIGRTEGPGEEFLQDDVAQIVMLHDEFCSSHRKDLPLA